MASQGMVIANPMQPVCHSGFEPAKVARWLIQCALPAVTTMASVTAPSRACQLQGCRQTGINLPLPICLTILPLSAAASSFARVTTPQKGHLTVYF